VDKRKAPELNDRPAPLPTVTSPDVVESEEVMVTGPLLDKELDPETMLTDPPVNSELAPAAKTIALPSVCSEDPKTTDMPPAAPLAELPVVIAIDPVAESPSPLDKVMPPLLLPIP
jgi:hypothetical protein